MQHHVTTLYVMAPNIIVYDNRSPLIQIEAEGTIKIQRYVEDVLRLLFYQEKFNINYSRDNASNPKNTSLKNGTELDSFDKSDFGINNGSRHVMKSSEEDVFPFLYLFCPLIFQMQVFTSCKSQVSQMPSDEH
ncbi:hypothetical protein TNIN_34401 [Trichonephila inaurata madagascariensis]|uniref:Uncharacterized protein n=1 Tax=Trichonephila inaurata madagascariensis TaxID=2747483 RepID=A0A8X7BX88_9ARAC|nr:hypothetical protein TNIN_34401 [Trichonephila inaurata madagascariensis]